MMEVKDLGDLPPLSRHVLSLLELAHTTIESSLVYFAATQNTFLRSIKQYCGTLWRITAKGCTKGRDLMGKVIFLNMVLLFLSFIALTILMGCLLSAMGSTLAFRYYMLRHVPGSHVVPLELNTMPFYTEWWRNKPIDDAALAHFPLVTQGRPAAGLRLEGSQGGHMAQYSPESMESAYADMKFSLLNRYRNSVLATSTMLLSTGITQEVFLPGGEVNLEAVFQLGSPMFNAKAQYSGKVQLVFLREGVGRDISVVAESTMLLAEDAQLPQTLGTLDVVFRKYLSLNVRTGDTPSWWPVRVFKHAFWIFFYGPAKGFQTLYRMYIDAASAPFPRIDHDREVAVTITLYDRFTPPLSLQSRLRAMNFTVYQSPDEEGVSSSSRRVRLLRMTFYSFLELRGVVGWLVKNPVISFVFLTLLVFIVLCSVTFSVGAVLGIALYRRFRPSVPTIRSTLEPNPSKPWSLQPHLMESNRRQRYNKTAEGNAMNPILFEADELHGFASLFQPVDSPHELDEGPSEKQSLKLRKEQ